MSYEDRLTEEAWAIAASKRDYAMSGSKWEPWKLNIVTVNVADIVSGKKSELDLIIPDEQDYYYAIQRVDERIEYSRYCLTRLKRAAIIYCPIYQDDSWINPWNTDIHPSWNGMRDPLSVDEFFFLTGLPNEGLKRIFHFDPKNVPQEVEYFGGYFGFAKDGRQRLTEVVGKPIAFVSIRGRGRRSFGWDLSSKEIFYPE